MAAGNEHTKGKRGGLRSTSWKPGIPSPNPHGRPRASFDAVKAVHRLVDPEAWVQAELAVANDENEPTERRLASWRALIDRGYARTPAGLELTVPGAADNIDLSGLTDEQLAELDQLEARREALLSGSKPDGSASDAAQLPEVSTVSRPPNAHEDP